MAELTGLDLLLGASGVLPLKSSSYTTPGLYNSYLNFVAHFGKQLFFFNPHDQIVGFNNFLCSIKICIYKYNNTYHKIKVLWGVVWCSLGQRVASYLLLFTIKLFPQKLKKKKKKEEGELDHFPKQKLKLVGEANKMRKSLVSHSNSQVLFFIQAFITAGFSSTL